jgi:cysteine-rich repeat protein
MRWQDRTRAHWPGAFWSAALIAAQQVWLVLWFTSGCTSPKAASDRANQSISRAQDRQDRKDAGESDAAVGDASDSADGSRIGSGEGDIDVFDAGMGMDGGEIRSVDPEAADAPKCGDGKVSGDEHCDTAIKSGQGACPTRCGGSKNSCEPIMLVGSECDARCEAMVITSRVTGDMCCPNGANGADDHDCAAVCGNGVTEPGETCDPPDSCPSCPASSACLRVTATGKPEECNRMCESTEITTCVSDDGCCPSGCTPQNDHDCSVRCGDGVVDKGSGETCEPGSATPCPASCKDTDPCTDDVRTGSDANCNVGCTHVAITKAYNGDGCCWTGSNANADTDCAPVCGNGVVERNEGCDDGNTNAGDGCSATCARETATQMCLIGRENDRCAQCTCDHCRSAAMGCREGDEDSKTCVALSTCIMRTGCSALDCYCGSNLASCITGFPTGPCRAQIEAATGSDNAIEIVATLALSDNSSPAGRALSLSSCESNPCEDECKP